VARVLAKEFSEDAVFYDNWYDFELSGRDLSIYLSKIYREKSQLVTIFLCGNYETKKWCKLEWSVVNELIFNQKEDNIMLFRFDDASISNLSATRSYINIAEHPSKQLRKPEEIANLIIKRWHFNKYETNSAEPAPEVKIEMPAATLIQKSVDDWQTLGKFKVKAKEGLALDMEINLMWLRFAHGQTWQSGTAQGDAEKVNWKTAFEAVKAFNEQGGYAGYTDWRLPTINELRTLIDNNKGKQGNYIDADVFPHNGTWFWSSSPFPGSSDSAWIVYFGYGHEDYGYEDCYYFVRLVRGVVFV
jgi:hypothetical protein